MGTLRITIELDTDAIEGSWGDYASRAARQLHAAIETNNRNRPNIWPKSAPEHADWTERPVAVKLQDRKTTKTIGRIVVDRSETGWDQ